ncbi:MAG: fumarate reductase/succinate dehydrogenase flavoprotein subunit [Bacteroidetes bacterium]|nr:fumarate reductase/succinate dehydrogenase flavoprotein subunit [Bacteroidota bacterium]MCH7770821.1 fumarate reductase/succinate dehydrogenase flavoprotein subunit [Bacteroidota bacterium]
MKLESKVPEGKLADKWMNYKFKMKVVNPANKRKYDIIVIGSGLAGASAAATMGELGYKVKVFTFHDSSRRAHSIAAQGGINAAKNYQNDADSVFRLFYDTIKGGDFRSREANTYRLAEVSNNIIDQCVAQGVPFAREYGGTLANRSFGGAQVSRTFYARGETGQQLLLGAYSSMNRQVKLGNVEIFPRREFLDIVLVNDHAQGVIVRNLLNGNIEKYSAQAVILATGGYSNVYFLSTNAMNSNTTAIWRAHKQGAAFANPCYTQIHPTCLPVHGEGQSKLVLMSESLRNDGRIWVSKKAGDTRSPDKITEDERDYYLERKYPAFGNLVPRDVASRNAKYVCDEGRGVGGGRAVYLDFSDAFHRIGKDGVKDKYGNLFDMYKNITGVDPYEIPMQIYPAPHYTMGGLWVDYNLMSNIPGLFVLGEANFSDHGANRLGASALMQGLSDGYFIIPYTIGNYLVTENPEKVGTDGSEFKEAERAVEDNIQKLLSLNGKQTVDEIHKRLGNILIDKVGMSRSEKGLVEAIQQIKELRNEFWKDAKLVGRADDLNLTLERAGRVADFLELGELMAVDALHRNESCGGHFREEYETPEGEAMRRDDEFAYVAAWEFEDVGKWQLNKEPLVFENVELAARSYK